LAVVVPGADARAEAERWSRLESGAEGPQTIGAATSTTGLDGLPEAYREAGSVVALLLAMDRSGHSASAGQLGVLGHLMGLDGRPDLARLAKKALAPLQQGDPGEDTRLLTALAAYFEHGGHLQRTADALHVHVNTLYRRLERVDAALGPSWRSGDARLEVELALRLQELDARLDQVERARRR
jgi:DNA-binding PucR family transcriptional regulator